MKRLALVLAVLALSSCGIGDAEQGEKMQDNLSSQTMTLNDGSTVECVVFQSIQEGGLWCQPTKGER